MRRAFTAAVAVAALLAVSCGGGNQAPTSPSRSLSTSLPVASIAVTASAGAEPLTITWSCFMQGVGCPARLEQLSPSPAALTAPGAPGNLTSSVNGGTVSLGWTGPTSGDQATSYVIEAGRSPGATVVAFDTGTAGQGFTVASVPAGTVYVRVRSKNGAGTSGPSAEEGLPVALLSS